MAKTYNAKPREIQHNWYHIDAKGQVLGRLATRIAGLLMGKGKKTYTPYMEMGDYIVVTNAKEMIFTGKKMTDKTYDHYTGYPGGRKEYTLEQMLAKRPEEILKIAVKGMLPKSRLGDRMLTHLQVFAGGEHKLKAQKPVTI